MTTFFYVTKEAKFGPEKATIINTYLALKIVIAVGMLVQFLANKHNN